MGNPDGLYRLVRDEAGLSPRVCELVSLLLETIGMGAGAPQRKAAAVGGLGWDVPGGDLTEDALRYARNQLESIGGGASVPTPLLPHIPSRVGDACGYGTALHSSTAASVPVGI